MAKTSKNVLGDQSGKIGQIVGRVVNGVQVYSAYSSHTSNPRTPKQLAARARFTAVMRLAKSLNGVVNIGFRMAAAGIPMTSPTNIFTKRNNRLMQYNPETDVATPDFEHLILSEGRTPIVIFSNASFADSQLVKASITSPTGSEYGAFDNDIVYMAVYCPDNDECVLATAKRSDTTITATVPPNWVGKSVYVWGFVKSSVDETQFVDSIGVRLHVGECSPTTYIGEGEIG